ncbi:MAG: LysM peptidoglycan-binding domain-containing protein [Kiritimatiellaceae bacterium]|nr:LysM peptidoglycan-binding domain-containing protein [Kiritimatiellaceae bacterium]
MKYKLTLSLFSILLLSGCETIQTPQQRRAQAARQQAKQRQAEERTYRMQGQVETVEQENARLMQELQQLRSDVRSYGSQISQLNSKMKALESKQTREMNELIKRVEGLLKKSMASSGSSRSANRGAGYEHIVQSGHTLSAIASKYGTTISAIKKANGLKSDSIRVGQKLFIPE